jgi:hypothetical protein
MSYRNLFITYNLYHGPRKLGSEFNPLTPHVWIPLYPGTCEFVAVVLNIFGCRVTECSGAILPSNCTCSYFFLLFLCYFYFRLYLTREVFGRLKTGIRVPVGKDLFIRGLALHGLNRPERETKP